MRPLLGVMDDGQFVPYELTTYVDLRTRNVSVETMEEQTDRQQQASTTSVTYKCQLAQISRDAGIENAEHPNR